MKTTAKQNRVTLWQTDLIEANQLIALISRAENFSSLNPEGFAAVQAWDSARSADGRKKNAENGTTGGSLKQRMDFAKAHPEPFGSGNDLRPIVKFLKMMLVVVVYRIFDESAKGDSTVSKGNKDGVQQEFLAYTFTDSASLEKAKQTVAEIKKQRNQFVAHKDATQLDFKQVNPQVQSMKLYTPLEGEWYSRTVDLVIKISDKLVDFRETLAANKPPQS